MSRIKRNILRIIFLSLLFITFFAIFQFSAQVGEKSDGVSKNLLSKIIDTSQYTRDLSEQTKNQLLEHGNPIIRKLAHFSIYALVGIWIMAFMSTFNIRLYKKWIISMAVGICYAIADEFHQGFVDGRSPAITDVGIDSLGVFSGILIILIIISVYKALKSDKIYTSEKQK